MTEVTRHFTATTFVVRGDSVLLHLHRKQGLWLPPGGHIERDELPHHAAVREIEEETGLRLRLHTEEQAAVMSREMGCLVVPQPAFILVEDINPFHQHIDFVYYAQVPQDEDPVPVHEEFVWMGPADLDRDGVPQNVKDGARRAVAFYRSDAS
jgi:8-oxo-dGTP pyrophosphatase MutT (NUDIX family)